MSASSRFVALLLRAYPAAWRKEYGQELAGILEQHPRLGIRVLADVLRGAVCQRLKHAEPATLCGLVGMLVVAVGLGLNIAGIAPLGQRPPSILQASQKLFPVVVVTAFETEAYVLWLVGCGCWTILRRGPTSRPGIAAMKMTTIAGIPILLMGMLMFSGLVTVSVASAGHRSAVSQGYPFVYTHYAELNQQPSALAVLLAPVSKLPLAWIWGAMGGKLGRHIVRWRAAKNA